MNNYTFQNIPAQEILYINSNGNVVWSKMFGGSEDEQGFSIKHTIGNGYLISGYTKSNNGDVSGNNGLADAWRLKSSTAGELIWQKCIGTAKNEYGTTAIYLSENDFVIAGAAQELATMTMMVIWFNWVIRIQLRERFSLILILMEPKTQVKKILISRTIIKSSKYGYERFEVTNNGIFMLSVDTGSFTTSVHVNNLYYNITPASINRSFATYFNTDSISFALQPIPNKQDLVINAVPLTAARPGFNTAYKLYYKNVGTTIIASGEILFKKDSRLNFVSSIPAISSNNGDTLKWNYANLAPADTASITLQLTVLAPPSVNNGDTLTSVAIITPVTADETPEDDSAFIKHLVTQSIKNVVSLIF